MPAALTPRQREILDVIVAQQRERGFPPSVREIGEAVGLKSPATVKSHLDNLRDAGYLKRDPSKPRALEVRYDPASGAAADRRPVRHIPLGWRFIDCAFGVFGILPLLYVIRLTRRLPERPA